MKGSSLSSMQADQMIGVVAQVQSILTDSRTEVNKCCQKSQGAFGTQNHLSSNPQWKKSQRMIAIVRQAMLEAQNTPKGSRNEVS